jgi:DNA-binding CsgD family transcriptional regulator
MKLHQLKTESIADIWYGDKEPDIPEPEYPAPPDLPYSSRLPQDYKKETIQKVYKEQRNIHKTAKILSINYHTLKAYLYKEGIITKKEHDTRSTELPNDETIINAVMQHKTAAAAARALNCNYQALRKRLHFLIHVADLKEIDIQIIKLLKQGKTYREVADELGLTKKTIAKRWSKIHSFYPKINRIVMKRAGW